MTFPEPDQTTVTVVVADDEEITRTGLRTLLELRPGLRVVGEAADGLAVQQVVRDACPDVVLMDVRMPQVDGIEATRALKAEHAEPPKVLVLTTFENDDYAYAALRAGADGFLLKRAPVQEVGRAVRLLASTDSLLFPDALRSLVTAHVPEPVRHSGALERLTTRELETLRWIARGLSNPEIAERLTVSLETVKTHVSNLLSKLGAINRTQAVILAYEEGLVVPGSHR
ncbi:response regulator transcription factor [Streptomyces sp. NPDC005438]|uniref:response regulator transcription factor n=1 Tax=Streptomyces sp. NPDC005438 TaxID=3156880 RepID=UPI0033A5B698